MWAMAAVAGVLGAAHNRLGSCNAACGRYRRGHQNGSLGRGAGHPSAELSLGSRGVMNRRTLTDTGFRGHPVRVRGPMARVSSRGTGRSHPDVTRPHGSGLKG